MGHAHAGHGPRCDGRGLAAHFVRAQAGDGRALQVLIDALTPPLSGWLSCYPGSDPAAVSDVVQETWIAAWQRIGTFRSVEHLRCWCFRVARNRAVSVRRRARLRVTAATGTLPDHPQAGGEDLTVGDDADESQRAWVEAAIAGLPCTYRCVARLYYVHEQSLPMVACLLGLSLSTVKMRLSRARQRMRDMLGETKPP